MWASRSLRSLDVADATPQPQALGGVADSSMSIAWITLCLFLAVGLGTEIYCQTIAFSINEKLDTEYRFRFFGGTWVFSPEILDITGRKLRQRFFVSKTIGILSVVVVISAIQYI